MSDEQAIAFHRAFEYLGCNSIAGDVVEFGVFRGDSLVALARAELGRPVARRIVGYDSFAGLPAPHPVHDTRQFSRGGLSATIGDARRHLALALADNVELVPGWFRDQQPIDYPVALVHLDCDLYDSALDALGLVTHSIVDGAIVCIDDYYCHRARPDMGVRRAWTEWLTATGRGSTPFWRYSWHGAAFVVHDTAE